MPLNKNFATTTNGGSGTAIAQTNVSVPVGTTGIVPLYTDLTDLFGVNFDSDSSEPLISVGDLGGVTAFNKSYENLLSINASDTNGTIFLLVGEESLLLSTNDGKHLTQNFDKFKNNQGDPLTILLNGISFNQSFPNEVVAVGANGEIFTSSDSGESWVRRVSGTTEDLNDIIYYIPTTTWIAVGNNSTIIGTTELNGTWTPITIDGGAGTGLDVDAITAKSNQICICGESGFVATSPGGGDFTTQTSGVGNTLFAITFVGNRYCCGGGAGTIITSTNGTNWSTVPPAVGANLTDTIKTATNNGTFFVFAGENSSLYYSADGTTAFNSYVIAGLGTSTINSLNFVFEIHTAISYFWIANEFGIIDKENNIVNSNWNRVHNPNSSTHNDIIFNNGFYWRVGQASSIEKSVTGKEWVPVIHDLIVPLPTGDLFAIIFSQVLNKYIAVGGGGWIFTSETGADNTWTMAGGVPTQILTGIAESNSTVLVGGANETILTSTDGILWILRVTGGSGGKYEGVVYAQNKFTIASSSAGGIAFESTNEGEDWDALPNLPINQIFALRFMDNTYFAVGIGTTNLAYTTDTSETWTDFQFSGTQFFDIFKIANDYIAVGIGTSNIIRSEDKDNWILIPNTGDNLLSGASSGGPGKSYLVGRLGINLESQGAFLKMQFTHNQTKNGTVANIIPENVNNENYVELSNSSNYFTVNGFNNPATDYSSFLTEGKIKATVFGSENFIPSFYITIDIISRGIFDHVNGGVQLITSVYNSELNNN